MKYATRQPVRDPAYLDWLKTERCLFSGFHGNDFEAVDPFHVGTRGKGLKSADDEVLPIRHSLHVQSHASGEVSFLRSAPDHVIRMAFRALAREMYAEYRLTREKESAE